ncbi:MAG: winged helix-turn-helix domain-containing protein [Candidatus Aenigmarchaeota archaeon]
MTEEKITLDKEVFKTLASKTRIDILKSLDMRRKTLSELSKQLGMSVSTVKEHLDNLVSVGLIEQMDEGHKWKYYELTVKGKDILHPEDKKIWIMLGISALGILVVGYDLLRSSFVSFYAAAPTFAGEGADMVAEKAVGAPETIQALPPQLPYMHILGFVIFGIILAVSAFYLMRSRRTVKV